MQDEILKHSRKIFRIAKKPGQSIVKKATDIVIEILIIVFAVSFSIWLHSVKEHRREQREVTVFLQNLRSDLRKDISWLKADRESYKNMNEILRKTVNLSPQQIDSMKKNKAEVSFPFQILFNKVNCGNYEGFKSSGKIGYIENEELKKAILNYYQQDAPNTLEINNMYNQYMFKTLDMRVESDDKTNLAAILNPKLQLRFEFLLMMGENIIRGYDDKPITHAGEIIKMIDEELGK